MISLHCGICGHIREYHKANCCDQCLYENKDIGLQDPHHEWEEFNFSGNRVWGEVV